MFHQQTAFPPAAAPDAAPIPTVPSAIAYAIRRTTR